MKVRPEYANMMIDGCPVCESPDTYNSLVSIDLRDDVKAAICDSCGHVEEKEESDVEATRVHA